MKRKLLLLNLVLIAGIAAAGWRLRQGWLEARAREQAMLGKNSQAAAPVVFPPAEPVRPVTAAEHVAIAEKLLFSADRNPTVVIEVEQPKPMPPLPKAHGVMDLGAGPTAILTEKEGVRQRGYRQGEQVGPFKLVSVSTTDLVFEWEGKQIRKRLEDLVDKEADKKAPPPPKPVAAAAAPAQSTTVLAESPAQRTGPGREMSAQLRACQPGDTSPPGTVVDGMRKVVTETPFGKACRWEAVK